MRQAAAAEAFSVVEKFINIPLGLITRVEKRGSAGVGGPSRFVGFTCVATQTAIKANYVHSMQLEMHVCRSFHTVSRALLASDRINSLSRSLDTGVLQLHHRAMSLVNSDIRVSAAAAIRIGDRDAAESCASDDLRSLRLGDIGVEQRVVFRRITVRPAIDGDCGDVARRIESAGRQGTVQLLADLALEGLGVEEHGVVQTALLVEIAVFDAFRERGDIDAQGAKQACRHRTVGSRAVDFQRAAIEQVQPAVQMEFVALGMTAKVVVIVQDSESGGARRRAHDRNERPRAR